MLWKGRRTSRNIEDRRDEVAKFRDQVIPNPTLTDPAAQMQPKKKASRPAGRRRSR